MDYDTPDLTRWLSEDFPWDRIPHGAITWGSEFQDAMEEHPDEDENIVEAYWGSGFNLANKILLGALKDNGALVTELERGRKYIVAEYDHADYCGEMDGWCCYVVTALGAGEVTGRDVDRPQHPQHARVYDGSIRINLGAGGQWGGPVVAVEDAERIKSIVAPWGLDALLVP